MYNVVDYETFQKMRRILENNSLLGKNKSVIASGFRMQRGKVFVLQDSKSHDDILTGYSRALDRYVSIESQQARALLDSKVVDAYVVNEKLIDGKFLILNDKDSVQSPSSLLNDYLQKCKKTKETDDGLISFQPLTSKRRWIVDSPKYIISTSSQLCKCIYDADTHWAFPLGMYAMTADNFPICLSRQVILAIYNSRLFSYYKMGYEMMHRKDIKVHYAAISSFPIPYHIDNEKRIILENLVDTLVAYKVNLCNKSSSFEDRKVHYLQELIDMCVYELYFTAHVQNLNLLIIKELAFAPFVQESLDVEEKVAQTYSWLMKSENVVRQRIMLLDSRSPKFLGRIHNFYFK